MNKKSSGPYDANISERRIFDFDDKVHSHPLKLPPTDIYIYIYWIQPYVITFVGDLRQETENGENELFKICFYRSCNLD